MDSQDGRIFLALVPHGWAIGPTPEAALTRARREVAMYAKELRKATHFVLAFPEDAQISINEVTGGWMATHAPLAVVLAKNLPAGVTAEDLLGR